MRLYQPFRQRGDVTRPTRSALVLQGGGALGAYELGAARALYKDNNFAPDVIAGVSRLADARDQAHRSLHRTRRVIR
jgi:predicted patatin/cPLA2 family phospholipase